MQRTVELDAASFDAAFSVTQDRREYFLSNHVHACMTGEHVIFLDLRRNRYQALGKSGSGALAHHVHGWPSPGDTEDAGEILEVLSQNGLITRHRERGRVAAFPDLAPPTEILVDDDPSTRTAVLARDVIRFAAACTVSTISLCALSLERIVCRVRDRKTCALAQGETSTLERDRRLVATFNHLRPFAFTAYRSCLFDSLALLEFLALHDSFPDWVIGVHTGPFAAHSWLQQHGYLFNGPIDQVARYAPILVV